MTFQTKTDEELDAEIAAIEAAINKNPTDSKNLPEIKKSLKTTLTNQVLPNLGNRSSLLVVPPAASSPDTETAKTEDGLSLEDFFADETNQVIEFDDSSFEEPVFAEDPAVLENLSFDPFHNIKMP